ncbi:MAG TPA: endolytic transglycosylase MltG [Magnetospirillaceae bacterium]|nr:endolytic transglycosylase MltG [Magnetospirillaceae bacterium]
MDGIKPRQPKNKPALTLRAAQPPEATTAEAPPVAGLMLPFHKPRRWPWVVAGVVFVVVLFVAGAFLWYQDALKPRSSSEAPVTVKIEEGASIDQVARELEQKSVIKSSLAFGIYVKLSNKTGIKTGTYTLAPNQSVGEIVNWLNEGRVSTRKVTILPGQTLKQIRASFIADGFSETSVDAALNKTYDHPLFADKPAGTTLEGYIFPETYFVTSDSTPEQLLIRTFDEFEKRIETEGLRVKLAARGFSLFQGVTLASIVAREVTNSRDQYQVAQVFETRLELGMMLGSDVTYHYAAELLGIEPAVNIDSPYNTRIHTGLPPGPIANFNLGALQAVAEPATGDYLFFVAGDDGVTHFSHTFEEHQQNIQEFCKKLCLEA